MIATVKKRLADERGFTLTELMIAVIVLAVLLAIAVPSYVAFAGRANQSSAQANLHAAIPAIETFSADNGGFATDADSDGSTVGYEGMTLALLRGYDDGITGLSVVSVDRFRFCVKGTLGQQTYYKTESTEISTTVCT